MSIDYFQEWEDFKSHQDCVSQDQNFFWGRGKNKSDGLCLLVLMPTISVPIYQKTSLSMISFR